MSINIDVLVKEVFKKVHEKFPITVEASGRHVHLSREAVDVLFGKDYTLTKVKDLSQPDQYQCAEKVTLIGPKGTIKKVSVLGPERMNTQVELSTTDARILGVNPPVKESGDLSGSASITIETEMGSITIEEGVIIAKRHIHVSEKDAPLLNLKDKEIIKIRVEGQRPVIFDDVVVRVNKNYRTFMHIDYDEANACGYGKGTVGKIIK